MANTNEIGLSLMNAGESQKEVKFNELLNKISKAVGGSLSKVLTSGTVTLNETESRNARFVLSGTLTGNVTIVINSAYCPRNFVVENNATMGSFTITVKVTSGGAGVLLSAGSKTIISHDGADAIRIAVNIDGHIILNQDSAAFNKTIQIRNANNQWLDIGSAGNSIILFGQAGGIFTSNYFRQQILYGLGLGFSHNGSAASVGLMSPSSGLLEVWDGVGAGEYKRDIGMRHTFLSGMIAAKPYEMPSITADVNSLPIAGKSLFVFLDADNNYTINGMVEGIDGETHILINKSGYNLTFRHDNIDGDKRLKCSEENSFEATKNSFTVAVYNHAEGYWYCGKLT